MNYRYGIVSAALCGVLSLPAFAGVTDLGEGGSTNSNTTIVNHYNDINHYKTNEATATVNTKDGATVTNNVDKSTSRTVNKTENSYVSGSTTTNTTYTVKGSLSYHEKSAHQHGSKGHYTYTDENNTQNYSATGSNLSSLKSQIENNMKGYVYQSQPSGRTTSYNGGSWSKTGESSKTDTNNVLISTSKSTSVKDNTKVTSTTKTVTDYTTTSDSTSAYKNVNNVTTKTGSTTTFTGVSYSNNFVAVGDPDDLASSGYIAQGTATYNYRQDDYYNRDHYYENTHTVTTTNHQHDIVTNTKTGEVVTTNTTTKTYRQDKTVTKNVTYEISASRSYSPIVLDLDGDGRIDASNGQYLQHYGDISNKVAMFDYYGNGFPVVTEWVSANDGLLCHPAADGTVNGTNLFGTANGFDNGYDEMAAYDTNKDGKLSGAELNDLRVWTDENGDAIAQASELKTLDELGITSIDVNHDNYKSSFVRNGQTFSSFDWWPTFSDARKVDLAAVVCK